MKHTKVNDLKKQIQELKNTVVKVGYFENSKRTDGLPNAYVASIHEFGSPTNNIPPRPTLGPALQSNQEEFSKIIANSFKNGTIKDGFEILGQLAVSKVRSEIATLKSPALKPNTVRARLRHKKQGKSVSLTVAKPLVNTKQMLQAVSYVVEQK
ncbi:hypothetical protein [Aliarcobacter butzleri]|uniref:hypothetical protein n=1 Tax=Aliarcobacter butzleri TaxID=28197 RepID=UPI002B244D00|nr:hypothetical protein [Aliarcobacter butzleri]